MYAYHLTIADVEKYDVNMKNQNGRTKLMIAVSEGDEAVVKRLLKHEEIRVNEKDDIGRTALATACDYGFVNMVEILLSHAGINVNVTDAGGYSPLLRACMREKTNTVNVIEALLKHPDIEVNHKAKDGTTALKMISRPYDGFFMDEVTVKKMNEMKAVIKDMLIKRGAKE